MKLGIFVETLNYNGLDFNLIQNGNFGIGGSEYHAIALAYYLCEFYNDVEVVLYTTGECNLNNERISNTVIENASQAAIKAKSDNVDVFFVNKAKCSELCKLLDELKLKTVTISSNFLSLKECDEITHCEYIKRNVFVSKQQYNVYLDLDVIQKSTYIYNFAKFPDALEARKVPEEKIVIYTGSITPPKCFHVLAKAWPSILKKCPDAKLKVIGSGKLYSRNANLGKYNIAEEEYEKIFMPYLTDKNGKILDSVEFLGVLGVEKYDVYKNTKVGVINPLGLSETFCISAVEMEAMGVPIVTKAYGGLVNTVQNKKTGLLYWRNKNLVNYVVKLLKNNKLNEEYSKNAYLFAREMFSPEKIIPEWYNLFNNILNDVPCKPLDSIIRRKIIKQINKISSGEVRRIKADTIKNYYNNYERKELRKRLRKI